MEEEEGMARIRMEGERLERKRLGGNGWRLLEEWRLKGVTSLRESNLQDDNNFEIVLRSGAWVLDSV